MEMLKLIMKSMRPNVIAPIVTGTLGLLNDHHHVAIHHDDVPHRDYSTPYAVGKLSIQAVTTTGDLSIEIPAEQIVVTGHAPQVMMQPST
jgi:hypothetical protein